MVQMIIRVILPIGNKKLKIWALLKCGALFFKNYTIMDRNNNEDQRPSKMRGVVFPKAKYGVIAAIIIIVVGNIFYYKDFLLSLIK